MIINPYRFGTAAGDPNYSSVSLLLHCDGTAGSTTFTDNSPNPKTLTASGNTQISSTSKFGSGALLMDGSGDHLSIPHSTDFDFGTGNFTIEGWVRWTSKTNFQSFYIHGNASGSLRISTGDSNGLWKVTIGGGVETTETGTQPSVDTWYHYAFVRNSGTVKIYQNGIERASSTNSGNIAQTTTIYIGSTGVGSVFNGRMDDIRITKGVARYTAAFSPPTEAFPNS